MTRGLQVQPCRGADCPCTAQTCTIFSDDFTRADGDPGADYTIQAGSPAIGSNRLVLGASNLITIDTTIVDSGAMSISAKFNGATNDQVKLILGYVDTSNYFYAILTIGTSKTVSLYERSGGSDTLLHTGTVTTPAGSDFTFVACLGFGKFTCRVGTSALVKHDVTTPSPTVYGGIGTGTVASTLQGDDVRLSRLFDDDHANCELCSGVCVACADDLPRVVTVLIPGIVNGTCSDCVSQYGGLWVLAYGGTVTSVFGNQYEYWTSEPFTAACSFGVSTSQRAILYMHYNAPFCEFSFYITFTSFDGNPLPSLFAIRYDYSNADPAWPCLELVNAISDSGGGGGYCTFPPPGDVEIQRA
jgi:hypothetical protein